MGIDLNRFRRKQSQEWLDWLEDKPAPASIRNRMREKAVREASQPVVRRVGEAPRPTAATSQSESQAPKATAKGGDKHISINIHVPNTGKLKTGLKTGVDATKKYIRQHQRLAIGSAAVLVLTAGVIGTVQLRSHNSKSKDASGVLSEKTEKPTFDYSLPKGEATNADGEVKYDATKKVVNFRDAIGSAVITVSQQPLPAGFETDTEEKVKKLAADFSATDVLVNANPTAYLGTNVDGPQTVIFAKKNLLVFIQSTKEIDKNDWAEYITNLQ